MDAARSGWTGRTADVWQSLFRIGLGVYWLYFASQKYPAPYGLPPHGIEWVHPLLQKAADVNPIPGLHEFLVQIVVPNWSTFAIAQTVGETVVGVLLVLGLATRLAGLGAFLLAANLSLTVAFTVGDSGVAWLYYLPVLLGLEVLVNGGGALAIDRTRVVPRWLRS